MKAKFILFLFVPVTLYLSLPISLADSTQQQLSMNKHYYQRFDTAVTWNNAVDKCRNLGNNAHLATITSFEENSFLANLSNSQASWIGGSLTKSGDVLWINGDPLLVNYIDKTINWGVHFTISNSKNWQRGGDMDLLPYICEWDY